MGRKMMKEIIRIFWIGLIILALLLLGNCIGLVTDSLEIGSEVFK